MERVSTTSPNLIPERYCLVLNRRVIEAVKKRVKSNSWRSRRKTAKELSDRSEVAKEDCEKEFRTETIQDSMTTAITLQCFQAKTSWQRKILEMQHVTDKFFVWSNERLFPEEAVANYRVSKLSQETFPQMSEHISSDKNKTV